MADEIKTYYITGTIYDPIVSKEARQSSITTIEWEITPQIIQGIDKPHWFETKAEAITHIFDLRDQRIKELKDKIFKLDLEVKLLINLKLEDVK